MNDLAIAKFSLTDKIKAHIELLDPITWLGVIQGIACGAIASGRLSLSVEHIGLFALLCLLFGPLGTGFSQSVNDYYDRDLDRVNEPSRPIPSGRLTEKEALINWMITGVLVVVTAFVLAYQLSSYRSIVLISLAILGLIFGYVYSAPPFKLKQNVLTSAPAVGITYSLITWVAGNIVFGELREEVVYMAIINCFVAIGLIFLNDFKSIEGDREQGLKSLPIMIGIKNTYLVSFFIIDIPFSFFVYLMNSWGFTWMFYFSLVSLLLIFIMQVLLYLDPENGGMALDNAVQRSGLRNVIGKSETKTHRAYLRYLIVNNGLYFINVVIAAFLISQKPM